MREETSQEKAFHELLSGGLKTTGKVSFGYQDYLQIIQDHLKTFYGQRADWSQCVKAYFGSTEYRGLCHEAKRCEDIPIITSDKLFTLIEEDKKYQADIEEFLQLNNAIKDKGERATVEDICHASSLLGISPDQNCSGLFNWIIDRNEISNEEKLNIQKKISGNMKLYSMLIDLFSTMLVPGMQFTFPLIGTAMTQQKTKYFYRGENSFYGSSKPGIYRSRGRITPMQMLADNLILEEACFFLDQFDAVQKWGISTVNYFALAQHYGIKTPLIDITSDLKTALFFACCKYEDQQWRPMKKKDFMNIQSKSGIKDSRYGLLYRSPTEITDMKWFLENEKTGGHLITPIGYQPFMRCSTQHGYMLLAKDETFDLLQEPLFDKFRIEHNEDFCQWIFEEMGRGSKVYPHGDIPKIEQYMEEIRNKRVISRSTFESRMDAWGYSRQEAQQTEQQLQKEGYTIHRNDIEHIHYAKLQKINKQYNIDTACSKVDIPTVCRSIISLPSDTRVKQAENGEWMIADM